jgi:hypothetical protein
MTDERGVLGLRQPSEKPSDAYYAILYNRIVSVLGPYAEEEHLAVALIEMGEIAKQAIYLGWEIQLLHGIGIDEPFVVQWLDDPGTWEIRPAVSPLATPKITNPDYETAISMAAEMILGERFVRDPHLDQPLGGAG